MGDVYGTMSVLAHDVLTTEADFTSVLTVSQFKRFMEVIKKLGDRVEREHDQYLRDSQRVEDRSGSTLNGTSHAPTAGGGVDFESLVASGAGAAAKPNATPAESSKSWEDDVWGSIFTSGSTVRAYTAYWPEPLLTSQTVPRYAEPIFLAAPHSPTGAESRAFPNASDATTNTIPALFAEDLEHTQPHCFATFCGQQEHIGVGCDANHARRL